ncbi:MAG: hypothetical protein QW118_08395 [Nitrososphaerota archaeon]
MQPAHQPAWVWVGPPAYPGIRQGAYLSGEDRSGYARVRILGGQRRRMRTVMDTGIQVSQDRCRNQPI